MSDTNTEEEAASLKNATPEVINVRMFDLVRYMRSELFEAELITEQEYMFLMHECPLAQGSGSPSPRRLESYDFTLAKLEVLRTTLRKIRKHPEATVPIKLLCINVLRANSSKILGLESLTPVEEACVDLWCRAIFGLRQNQDPTEVVREKIEFFFGVEVTEKAYQFVKKYVAPD